MESSAAFWIAAGLATWFVGASKGGLPMIAMLGVPILSVFTTPAAAVRRNTATAAFASGNRGAATDRSDAGAAGPDCADHARSGAGAHAPTRCLGRAHPIPGCRFASPAQPDPGR